MLPIQSKFLSAHLLFCVSLSALLLVSTPGYAADITGDLALVDSSYENMTAGTVTEMVNGGAITDTLSGGTIQTMSGGDINNAAGGTIGLMSGGTITQATGQSDFSSRITINEINGTNARIETLSETAFVDTLTQGTINTMNGGFIDYMKGGTIDAMNGGQIVYTMTAGSIGDMTNGSIATINGGSITTSMSGGSIGTFSDGSINTMTGGSLTTMTGGSISSMAGTDSKAPGITDFNGGTIGDIGDYVTIQNMNNNAAVTGTMSGGTIVNMNSGTVNELTSTGRINNLNGGSVTTASGGDINLVNASDATATVIGTLSGTTIENFKAGNITSMTSGTIGKTDDNTTGMTGSIDNMSGGTITQLMSGGKITDTLSGGTITTMSDGSSINDMIGGSITTMDGGSITGMTGTDLKAPSIINFNGGTIGDIGDYVSIENMNNSAAITGIMSGGIITTMNNGSINELTSTARIYTMTGGAITTASGGDIENMNGTAASITTLSGTSIDKLTQGIIGDMTAGSIETMNGGQITGIMTGGTITSATSGTINEIDADAKITTLSGSQITTMTNGAIGNMTSGTINDMKNGQITDTFSGGTVTTASGGTINVMNGNATITTLASATINTMNGGTIGDILIIDKGVIGAMNGGQITGTMNGGIIRDMNDGSINEMGGDARVKNMYGGTIKTASGGDIEVVNGVNAKITTLSGATIDAFQNGTIDTMSGGLISDMSGGTIQSMTDGNVSITGNVIFKGLNSSGTVAIKNGGYLHYQGTTDASIKDLTLDGGTFANTVNSSVFSNLTITGNYASNGGTIALKIALDGDDSQKDTLVFASGATLNAADTTYLSLSDTLGGLGTTRSNGNGIKIVDIQGGQTTNVDTFQLKGGQIDNTAYIYKLFQGATDGTDDNSFFLRSTGSYSEAFKTMLAIPEVNMFRVNTALNSLHKRLGDVRREEGQIGMWARTYGKDLTVKDHAKLKVDFLGFEAGVDKAIETNGYGVYILGFMGGYTDTNNIKDTYADGRVDGDGRAWSLGAYSTWLYNDFFVDTVFRTFWGHDKYTMRDAANNLMTFKPKAMSYAISVEAGQEFNYDDYFFEPSLKASYAYSEGDNMHVQGGYKLDYDHIQSLRVRAGMLMGLNLMCQDVKPYLNVGVYREFLGKSSVTYDFAQHKTDLSGMGGDVGLGVNVAITHNSQMYGELTYEYGKNYNARGFNLGYRISF